MLLFANNRKRIADVLPLIERLQFAIVARKYFICAHCGYMPQVLRVATLKIKQNKCMRYACKMLENILQMLSNRFATRLNATKHFAHIQRTLWLKHWCSAKWDSQSVSQSCSHSLSSASLIDSPLVAGQRKLPRCSAHWAVASPAAGVAKLG